MIDLSQIRLFEYSINLNISDLDIINLVKRGIIASTYFNDSKAGIDIFHRPYLLKANFYVGNFHEDADRIYFHFLAHLSNGMIIKKAFWNYSIIPLMTIENLKVWASPRKVFITLKVGIHQGHGSEQDWKSILPKIDDFTPVCYQASPHTIMMDQILDSGQFTDVKLSCLDDKEMFVHKSLLTAASPYFRALFSKKFKTSKETVNVEFGYEIVKEVIGFIYSGRLKEELIENWPDVYRMARYYQLDVLANHSELQMMVNTARNMESMKNVLNFAMKFHAFRLQKFLIENIRMIQKTQECSHYYCGHYFCLGHQ